MSAPLLITVTPGDGLPIYRQIVEQVKGAIASGLLRPGDRLPSHRDLAKELVIAPLTVKRAYDLLDQEGLISLERGRGTFVKARPQGLGGEADAELDQRIDGLVHQAGLVRLSERELLARIRAAWRGEAPSQRRKKA